MQLKLHSLRVFTLAVLVAAPASALADMSADTEAVWDRHVQSAVSGDIDAVMHDFDEDSVIITPDGVLEGEDAIRGFFEEFLSGMTPEMADDIVVNYEIVHDRTLVYNFTMGAQTYHDTAVIEDGTIAILSTTGYPAE